MPLTRSGQQVLTSMKTQYGPRQGESVFYATANKTPSLGKKWHGQIPSKRSFGKR